MRMRIANCERSFRVRHPCVDDKMGDVDGWIAHSLSPGGAKAVSRLNWDLGVGSRPEGSPVVVPLPRQPPSPAVRLGDDGGCLSCLTDWGPSIAVWEQEFAMEKKDGDWGWP
jgi:hypothetical protein